MKISRSFVPPNRRKSSTPHHMTFDTPPPISKGRPLSSSPPSSNDGLSHDTRHDTNDLIRAESPLPTKQLFVLAVMSVCEQTALNSIGPYLPQMTSSFPEVELSQVGLYVGVIASSFALAQFVTVFFWGWLSDRIGRKPVILTGTLLTAVGFLAFGFCTTLWQAILVQAFVGLVNGNQGILSTCLGEITDRSNQSKAFTYLPVIYGLGGITGPLVGGLLVARDTSNAYPFLAPNLFSVAVLMIDMIFCMIFLDESLEEAKGMAPLGQRMGNLFGWVRRFASSRRPTYIRRRNTAPNYADGAEDDDEGEEDEGSDSDAFLAHTPRVLPEQTASLTSKQVLNRNTILLLVTYLIFQFSNISFGSLYTIFAQASPPTGRDLSPGEIGLSLAFAGIVTIVFQVGMFGKLRETMGNKMTYRFGLGGFVLAFFMMPFVGYKNAGSGEEANLNSKIWLWTELGFVLLIKTIAAVGGLTSALLLITNSAPTHSVLGRLNGMAQTLSAAGRAAGPFLSGGLFSFATLVRLKGDALAFGVFGGIAFLGFLGSFSIRGEGLEAQGWEDHEESDQSVAEDDDPSDDDLYRR